MYDKFSHFHDGILSFWGKGAFTVRLLKAAWLKFSVESSLRRRGIESDCG